MLTSYVWPYDRRGGQWVKTAVHMSHRERPNIRISWDRYHVLTRTFGEKNNIWTFSHRLIMVRPQTWPDLRSLKSKFRGMRFAGTDSFINSRKFHIDILKTMSRRNKKYFWGRVTWSDLVAWPEMALVWNFLEGCEIQVWKVMQKTRWCGQNYPPPPGRMLILQQY